MIQQIDEVVVFEEEGLRQLPEVLLEQGVQLDDHQRVDPEASERGPRTIIRITLLQVLPITRVIVILPPPPDFKSFRRESW